jgi:hypothetical protein
MPVFFPDSLPQRHRTLSLDFWRPEYFVPKTWIYDAVSHFARPNIQHVDVGLRNVFYHNEERPKHLQGFIEGLRNEPGKWKDVQTFGLAVRIMGIEYANPSGPVFWVSTGDVN